MRPRAGRIVPPPVHLPAGLPHAIPRGLGPVAWLTVASRIDEVLKLGVGDEVTPDPIAVGQAGVQVFRLPFSHPEGARRHSAALHGLDARHLGPRIAEAGEQAAGLGALRRR